MHVCAYIVICACLHVGYLSDRYSDFFIPLKHLITALPHFLHHACLPPFLFTDVSIPPVSRSKQRPPQERLTFPWPDLLGQLAPVASSCSSHAPY